MSFGPTLYSKPLYGTNLYSANTPLLSFVDTVTSTDTSTVSANIALADSMSAPTDARVVSSLIKLADSVGPVDSYGIQYAAVLTDFLMCKEFLSGSLARAQQWKMGGVSRTVTPHIYGQVLYAKNMYSTNIAILWATPVKDLSTTFSQVDGHKYNS